MTITADPTTAPTTDWIAAARAVGRELAPAVVAHDRSGELSVEAFDRLREQGITAALVPPAFDGGGATHTEMGAILRELGRHDPATAVTLSMHTHLVAAQVWRHHHGMDAEAVLRKVAGGAILISTGAADWVGSSGHARQVDGGFRVSARKSPASGCEIGTVLATSIRWDDAPDGPQVLHCSVPFASDGVSIDRTWDTLGLRATGSHTVVLDDVFVPDAAISLTRPADRWHPVWNVVMGAAMPLIMAAYLGVGDAAVDLAIAARAGSVEPSTAQLVGEMVNAHTTATDAVDAMFRDADDLRFDSTDELAARTLARKTVATEALVDAVQLAVQVVGGVGYSRTSDLERLLRDVHGARFHPLPRAKQTRFTGRVALGLDPVG